MRSKKEYKKELKSLILFNPRKIMDSEKGIEMIVYLSSFFSLAIASMNIFGHWLIPAIIYIISLISGIVAAFDDKKIEKFLAGVVLPYFFMIMALIYAIGFIPLTIGKTIKNRKTIYAILNELKKIKEYPKSAEQVTASKSTTNTGCIECNEKSIEKPLVQPIKPKIVEPTTTDSINGGKKRSLEKKQ